jgi:aarF domain-containing kinase
VEGLTPAPSHPAPFHSPSDAKQVQRPGCEETIALDLHILRAYSSTLTRVISLLGREIDLVNVIDDFGNLIYAEIDYSVEAANARRFR